MPFHCIRKTEHEKFESLSRNRISNISFTISSLGEVITLTVMVGILKALKSDASIANNTKAFSILIAFSGGIWCMSFFNSTIHCLIICMQYYVPFHGFYLRNGGLGYSFLLLQTYLQSGFGSSMLPYANARGLNKHSCTSYFTF
jgi:hypothetical protein